MSFSLRLKKQTNNSKSNKTTEIRNIQYPAIFSFTVFYITCMSYVSIDKIAKPKIFPTFFKKYE